MTQSSFNLSHQNQNVESKIVVALERISEAFRVLLWNESKENSLSPIQIQLLIFLLFHNQKQCKISYLANEFNLTKATVSDSVKVLLKKKLVVKETDATDSRSYSLSLSASGKQMAEKAASFANAIETPLSNLSAEQKSTMLKALLKTIHELNQSGIITVQRMCYNCSYFSTDKQTPYCNLLNQTLSESEIRIDCPEHLAI